MGDVPNEARRIRFEEMLSKFNSTILQLQRDPSVTDDVSFLNSIGRFGVSPNHLTSELITFLVGGMHTTGVTHRSSHALHFSAQSNFSTFSQLSGMADLLSLQAPFCHGEVPE